VAPDLLRDACTVHRDFGDFLKSAAWPYVTVAKSIERIDDTSFRCEADPVRFGKTTIVVFLDVKVEVDASKPRALIKVASGKVRGVATKAALGRTAVCVCCVSASRCPLLLHRQELSLY
jgi:hypothetical protein